MSYCLNPNCPKPYNPQTNRFCQNCGTKLLLEERYRAVKPIGQGGFGRTLLGLDEYQPSKPRCAIKQFYPQRLNNPLKAAKLFHQEALRLEQLGKHPQIPQLLGHFEQDDRLYIVQEFIDGQNLAEELATKGAFRETEIVSLLRDLLPVLQFIHQHQVIHRDIKPENIIRRESDGRLVLVDFGAAKYAKATTLAQTGTTIGSAAYAAPEQTFGKALFASDLYSIGVTCIHLLTQIEPFDLYDPLESRFVWQDYLVNNPVSNQLAVILDKMMQQAVKQRYQCAEDVMPDLDLAIGTAKGATGAVPIKPQLQPSLPSLGSRTPQSKISPLTTLLGHAQGVYAIAFSRDGRTLASGSADKTIKLWQLSMSWEIRTLGSWLSKHTDAVRAVAFSPDSKMLASGSADKTIKLWDVRTGKEIHTLKGHSDEVYSVIFSPDGQTLVSGSRDRTIKLWDLTLGVEKYTLIGHSGSVYGVTFSPDGQTLASGSYDTSIKLWHVLSGKEIHTFKAAAAPIYCIAFSPDGQTLASGNEEAMIEFWDVNTGHKTGILQGHSDSVYAVAFSPDGQTLATGSRDRTIKIWDVLSGQKKETLKASSGLVYAVAFSPNGRNLAGASDDATIKIWRVIDF
ncbi:MAG TPA: protein kinase [Cyanobacteria bacterium UBA9273]|nr:protein kinase [Cyanobacteria bacterium UBA9273]